MEKFISYEKLSKKKKKELNRQKRKTFGKQSPVTQIKKSKKIYSRKKAHYRDDDDNVLFNYFLNCFLCSSFIPSTSSQISLRLQLLQSNRILSNM